MTPAERVMKMIKEPNWVERMTSIQLTILAKLNPDICEAQEEYEPGRIRTIVKPEYRNRYSLYAALRKKRRCPRDKAADELVKTLTTKE